MRDKKIGKVRRLWRSPKASPAVRGLQREMPALFEISNKPSYMRSAGSTAFGVASTDSEDPEHEVIYPFEEHNGQ
jgi:hypothetical protein